LILRPENVIFTISTPIEHGQHDGRGVPWAVLRHERPLTNRQQALLDRLPGYDSRVTVKKSDASMSDLAALTAKEQVEFAMFTRGPERLVVRGDRSRVNIGRLEALVLCARGYRWSGHTHEVVGDLLASEGDEDVLAAFGQSSGVIYDPTGAFRRFYLKSGDRRR